jgi:hypothetical protein
MNEDPKLQLEAPMPETVLPRVEPVEATVKAEPFVVHAKAMGLKPGYNLDKVWELIEEVEGPDYK